MISVTNSYCSHIWQEEKFWLYSNLQIFNKFSIRPVDDKAFLYTQKQVDLYFPVWS